MLMFFHKSATTFGVYLTILLTLTVYIILHLYLLYTAIIIAQVVPQ